MSTDKKFVEFKKIVRVNKEDMEGEEGSLEDRYSVEEKAIEIHNEQMSLEEILLTNNEVEDIKDKFIRGHHKQAIINEAYRQIDELLLEIKGCTEEEFVEKFHVISDRALAAKSLLNTAASSNVSEIEADSPRQILGNR